MAKSKMVTTTEMFKWDESLETWVPTDKVIKTEESEEDLSTYDKWKAPQPPYTPPWTAPIYPPQARGWWQAPIVTHKSDSASDVKYAGTVPPGFPVDWQ